MKTLTVFLLFGILLLAGCAGLSDISGGTTQKSYGVDDYTYGGSSGQAKASKALYAPTSTGASYGDEMMYAPEESFAADSAQPDQLLIKEGSLVLEIKKGELEAKLAEAKNIIALEGAVVSSIGYDEYYGERRYSVEFKVLPEKFDAVTEKLKALGEIKGANMNIADVTRQFRDIELRLANKNTELDRLYILYNKSETVEDLLSVEREITRVEGEIEYLKGEKQYLESKIDKSTITLVLQEPIPSDEAREGELDISVKDGQLETKLANLREIVKENGEIVSLNFAENSDYKKYYVVARVEPNSVDSLMEELKSLGEVKNIEKSVDEQNRPKKSLVYVSLQENKPAVESDFLTNLGGLGNIFFAVLTFTLYILVAVVAFVIPVSIVVFVIYKVYKKIKGEPKDVKKR